MRRWPHSLPSRPRRTRSGTKWGWNILYTVAVLFVVLSWNSLSGVLVSFAAGRALGMLIRFMLGTQTNGAWGNQVAQALRSIGIDVASLSRSSRPTPIPAC